MDPKLATAYKACVQTRTWNDPDKYGAQSVQKLIDSEEFRTICAYVDYNVPEYDLEESTDEGVTIIKQVKLLLQPILLQYGGADGVEESLDSKLTNEATVVSSSTAVVQGNSSTPSDPVAVASISGVAHVSTSDPTVEKTEEDVESVDSGSDYGEISQERVFLELERLSTTYLSFGATGESFRKTIDYVLSYQPKHRRHVGRLCVAVLLKPRGFLIGGVTAKGQAPGLFGLPQSIVRILPRHSEAELSEIRKKRESVPKWLALAKRKDALEWEKVNWTQCYSTAFAYLLSKQKLLIKEDTDFGMPSIPWEADELLKTMSLETTKILVERCKRFMATFSAYVRINGITENVALGSLTL